MSNIPPNEKSRLFSMFKNFVPDSKITTRSYNSDVLIIDGLNTYFRAFMANPTINDNGVHIGGIAGFLQSIGYASKLLNPTRIIIVFDGVGGSMKRKKIYPEYKAKRTTKLRYNRAYEDLSSSELEEKNIQVQLLRLVNYLDTLPVTVMSIDHVEADDTIAYIANDYLKDANRVYIMSSDKDFLQLVNDKIQIWSPTKKKLYGCAEILLEYGISCENFINYRVLAGDVSDNIDGIKGSGLKTILKCFPHFKESQYYSNESILEYCRLNQSKYKLYSQIIKNSDILERNYRLMQLKDTQLQSGTQLRVGEILEKKQGFLDKGKFGLLLSQDKMQQIINNYNVWLSEAFGQPNSYLL